MKRAWEISYDLLMNAKPRLSTGEGEWTENKFDIGQIEVEELRKRWDVEVPGSLAPDMVLIGAIGAVYNMGYDVTEAEALIPVIQKAYDENDDMNFLKYVAKLYYLLSSAKKIEGHPYWNYTMYESFEQYAAAVKFPAYPKAEITYDELFRKLHAGWTAQIAGACIGTIIEGYSTEKLKETFGEVRDYLRKPSTYNDDILFEIAFLEAFTNKGYEVTSEDIALEWVGRIQYTWSAEEVAMRNLKAGTFPPQSGYYNNPWREWIGAQMRGSVCGLAAPGDPYMAAKLAWTDGRISHHNNGILGEVFNALLASLAFVERDVRVLTRASIDLIPVDSEYHSVVQYAWNRCEKYDEWEAAWADCQEKYKEYNWIHAYPNAAAEVISLYFSNDDFDRCMYIIAMEGQDVDCSAGQIATIFGIRNGFQGLDHRWTDPLGDKLDTLVRGYESTTITNIARQTADAIFAAKGKESGITGTISIG